MAGHDPEITGPRSEALEAGHEVEEIRSRPIVMFVIGLTVIVTVTLILMVVLFGALAGRESARSPKLPALEAAARDQLPPAPRLEVDPLADYRSFRAAQDSILNGYGWVQADSGIARIPIAKASRRPASTAWTRGPSGRST